MSEKQERGRQIDYIFARYPLWIRYSKLPGVLGPGAWCVFQRLLELMERFGCNKFHYSIDRLCETSGFCSRQGIKKILKKLEIEEFITYETQQGRGKETQFEILLPIKTPLSEEDVYHIHPRLRPRSYQKRLEDDQKKGNKVTLLEEEKDNKVTLLGEEKGNKVTLLEEKKDNKVTLFRNKVTLLAKNAIPESPITTPEEVGQKNAHDKDKKDLLIKRQQQQNDLFHDSTAQQNNTSKNSEQAEEAAAASDIKTLKDFGIAGNVAERWLTIYSKDYLMEKIEILEYKKFCGMEIRNPGGMLKSAVQEDWPPPEGFTTRAQRDETARRARETEEAAAREKREGKERKQQERLTAEAVEEWKKTAPQETLETIREQARQEVLAESPGSQERFLKIPIQLRENRIIARSYLPPLRDPGG